MSDRPSNFVDLCLLGKVLPTEIDDFVERWHEGDDSRSLREYLGFSVEEFSLWINDPDVLPYIIFSRKEGTPFQKAVNDNYYENLRLAARSDAGSKIRVLREWLRHEGYLDT